MNEKNWIEKTYQGVKRKISVEASTDKIEISSYYSGKGVTQTVEVSDVKKLRDMLNELDLEE